MAMKFYVDVDMMIEDEDIDRVIEEVSSEFNVSAVFTGVTAGGGFPEIRVSGDRDDVMAFLVDFCGGVKEDAEEYAEDYMSVVI